MLLALVRDDKQTRLPRRNKRLARSGLALLLLAMTEGRAGELGDCFVGAALQRTPRNDGQRRAV